MKKFSLRIGRFNTQDILELVCAVGSVVLGAAFLTDVTDRMAYAQGQNDLVEYLNKTEQFDTTSADEINRRGHVWSAKQYLAENDYDATVE